LPAPAEQASAGVAPAPRPGYGALDRAKRVALSTPLLGAVIAVITWPYYTLAPSAGIDPSWVAGLYMATERGLDAGTQIVFSYGPLGFLGLPGLFEIDLGRISFVWTALVQIALCVALLWATRRAFGLIAGIAITIFAVAIPTSDPILLAAAIVCVAALLGEWSSRLRLGFALGAGALSGMQMLGSLRAGPVLAVMALAVLLALPDRRRTLPVFLGAAVVAFFAFWFATGQGLGNLGAYAANTASVVGGYSASMVFVYPSEWWQVPGALAGVAALIVLTVAAAWSRDNMRRAGLVVVVAAVTFLMFKHAIVRSSPGSAATFLATLLMIGLALVPHVRRSLAVGCVIVLAVFTYIGNEETLDVRLDLTAHAESFVEEIGIVAIPGRAAEVQAEGRTAMQGLYALTPQQLALLHSGSVHVATLEAGVAWAWELDWNPLPVFQQYSAYTERLDRLNAEKLESSSAPEVILWENAPAVDPTFAPVRPFPGTIDRRVPAWDSPAQMIQMFCRYRVEEWDERWAILHRSPDRCGPERRLRSVVTGNGEAVRLPVTRPGEALVVRVDGLDVSGIERLRTLLYRGAGRSTGLAGYRWNVMPETASDGFLLRIPSWADYPGKFALNSGTATVSFEREGGFLTGVDDSTKLTLTFSALPVDAPALLPAAVPQKRRVQR
jgi:hypothetical protein